MEATAEIKLGSALIRISNDIDPALFSTDHPVCGRCIMLGDITAATDIYIICGYTDMRKSIDGLCAIIRDQLHFEPEHTTALTFSAADAMTG